MITLPFNLNIKNQTKKLNINRKDKLSINLNKKQPKKLYIKRVGD
jgi:hypothetical protein